MIKIITHTPLFVWLLFSYLLFIGLKARKISTISLKTLFIAPIIFSTWSFYSILSRYNISPLILTLWPVSIALGITIGFVITRKLNIKFNEITNETQLPGSFIPLTLLMMIFSIKYFLGVTSALHPELKESSTLLVPELMTVVIGGIFTGRALTILQKTKSITPKKV